MCQALCQGWGPKGQQSRPPEASPRASSGQIPNIQTNSTLDSDEASGEKQGLSSAEWPGNRVAVVPSEQSQGRDLRECLQQGRLGDEVNETTANGNQLSKTECRRVAPSVGIN